MAKDAEYYRDYRRNKKQQVSAVSVATVRRVIDFMRSEIGGRALTGYQMAAAVEKALIEQEPSEQQQAVIDSMRPT